MGNQYCVPDQRYQIDYTQNNEEQTKPAISSRSHSAINMNITSRSRSIINPSKHVSHNLSAFR